MMYKKHAQLWRKYFDCQNHGLFFIFRLKGKKVILKINTLETSGKKIIGTYVELFLTNTFKSILTFKLKKYVL
jgi:hypothetical protein